jgi:membrane associated rhomboid family serine protease
MAVCYRHPNRETGVSCSSCGRSICPDCMTTTSVGMRCPECSRDKTKVKTATQVRQRAATGGGRYSMTQILIAINVIVFVIETASGSSLGGGGIPSSIYQHFALDGPNIHFGHQYYRLLTGGFLHDGILHILFNMWFLYAVGPALERGIGRWNFLAIYLASLFAGSFGALLFEPRAYTVGASGALFGLLGALIVIANRRGISIWQSGLGATLLINIVFSLSIAGISIGGHLGGVVGGAICGWLYLELAERRHNQPAFWVGCAVVAAVSIGLALAVASGTGLTPTGFHLF